MDNEQNTIKGVATLLKTPEGDIKLPRTAAVLVQTSRGTSVEEELLKKVTIEDFSKELDNIMEIFNEFSDSIKEFRYDIGTTANYTELALLNREATTLLEQTKIALEDMDVFIQWEERWDDIKLNLEENINTVKMQINIIENDIIELNIRLKTLELNQPQITDINLSSMKAMADIFEIMVENDMYIDENKLDNIALVYAELLRQEIKGINEMPSIIKSIILKKFLL